MAIKRYISFVFVAAMVLAAAISCAREFVLEQNEDTIELRLSLDNGSRDFGDAEETTLANLGSFRLFAIDKYGDKYINDALVTVSPDGTCVLVDGDGNKYKWPGKDSLDFYAFGPGAALTSDKADFEGCIEFSLSRIGCSTSYPECDLVFDHVRQNCKQGVVVLDLKHILSQVTVRLINTEPSLTSRIYGLDIMVGPIYNAGCYWYHEFDDNGKALLSDWEQRSDPDYLDIPFVRHSKSLTKDSITELACGDTLYSASVYVIPQSVGKLTSFPPRPRPDSFSGESRTRAHDSGPDGAFFSFYGDFTNTYSEDPVVDETRLIWPVDIEFEPGRKYIYTIDVGQGGYCLSYDNSLELVLDGKKVEVDVAVSDWGQSGNRKVEGSTERLFSVGRFGKRVFFSSGNLMYQPSTGIWKFAGNPIFSLPDEFGDCVPVEDKRLEMDRWISLFGWGTAGWNNGNTSYLPTDYGTTGYGPVDSNGNPLSLIGANYRSDWGSNPIVNGGNEPGIWRTLSADEWSYLLYDRYGLSFLLAGVGDMDGFMTDCEDGGRQYDISGPCSGGDKWTAGIFIFPDEYSEDDWPSDIAFPDDTYANAGYIDGLSDLYQLSVPQAMEVIRSGAVFLPCAGIRDYLLRNTDRLTLAAYWTSSIENPVKELSSDYPVILLCGSREQTMEGFPSWEGWEDICYLGLYHSNVWVEDMVRGYGASVRLVRDYPSHFDD